MKPLYLDWNLGLGDAIICNGLVRTLADTRVVIVPCHPHNLQSVAHMFSGKGNVRVISTETASVVTEAECDILRVGLNNPAWGSVQPWDRAFYEFAGVPYENRWGRFFMPRTQSELPPFLRLNPFSQYALLHEDRERGFSIREEYQLDIAKRMPIDKVYPITPLIADWTERLKYAAEIHCIDSSFMHLAEHCNTGRAKLFYHRYARPAGERQATDAGRSKNWIVIE